MNIEEILEESRRNQGIEENQSEYQIDPNLIEYASWPKIDFFGCTRDILDYSSMKKYKNGCTVVLVGEPSVNGIHLKNYILNESNEYSGHQLEYSNTCAKSRKQPIVYARLGSEYFSAHDLRFLVERAVCCEDDTYGILVTEKEKFCIKYDKREEKFFKVEIS